MTRHTRLLSPTPPSEPPDKPFAQPVVAFLRAGATESSKPFDWRRLRLHIRLRAIFFWTVSFNIIVESPFERASDFTMGFFTMDILVVFSILAIAIVGLVVRALKRRQDVLYGRYISDEQQH